MDEFIVISVTREDMGFVGVRKPYELSDKTMQAIAERMADALFAAGPHYWDLASNAAEMVLKLSSEGGASDGS
jgi:hypothetical protein